VADGEDPALISQERDGVPDGDLGDVVLLHEHFLAGDRAVRPELALPDPLGDLVGDPLVERCLARITWGVRIADESALALDRMDKSLLPKLSCDAASGRAGDAVLDFKLGFAGHCFAGVKLADLNACANHLGDLFVDRYRSVSVEHSQTLDVSIQVIEKNPKVALATPPATPPGVKRSFHAAERYRSNPVHGGARRRDARFPVPRRTAA
jgi:hypothetical protein